MENCNKKNKLANNTALPEISRNFQHIIDKNPQLLHFGTQFQFNHDNAGYNKNSTDSIISNAPADQHSAVMDLDNPPINMSDNTSNGFTSN